jgi:hypothetical protein
LRLLLAASWFGLTLAILLSIARSALTLLALLVALLLLIGPALTLLLIA